MKIIDRQAFMAMPSGTVYQKYEPCAFGPISIKMDTVQDFDWFDLCGVDSPSFTDARDSGEWFAACGAMEAGESKAMQFDVWQRDGLFDQEQLFAIWERADVERFVATLQRTLPE